MRDNFVFSDAQLAYRRYLAGPRWRLIIRPIRLMLDGNRCRLCGGGQRLEVHHRDYRHRGGSIVGELRDTITLCASCHRTHHRG